MLRCCPRLFPRTIRLLGNAISKPRVCAVIDTDKKGRVLVAPVEKRTTKTIILDMIMNDKSVISVLGLTVPKFMKWTDILLMLPIYLIMIWQKLNIF